MDTNWKYCTLETAKRLRELGLPQGQTEKTWSVVTHDDGADITLFHTDDCGDDFPNEETYSAPDLSEAMRVLPILIAVDVIYTYHLFLTTEYIVYARWDANTINMPIYYHEVKILKNKFAEAACRMIVWLAENGLMDLKGVGL